MLTNLRLRLWNDVEFSWRTLPTHLGCVEFGLEGKLRRHVEVQHGAAEGRCARCGAHERGQRGEGAEEAAA